MKQDEAINSVFLAIITPNNCKDLKDLRDKCMVALKAKIPMYLMVNEMCSPLTYNVMVKNIPFRRTYFFSTHEEFESQLKKVAKDAQLFFGSGGC